MSTSRVQSDNTSRVADYPPMYSARRQSDATRHLASGRPTQDVEVLCRIWWTPSAQRAPAPQEARKRCKALAARTMCSVGDHEPPRSEHLRGRTRPAETRQQESRFAASVLTDCSIQTTSASPTIKSGMKPGWIFVAGGPAGTSGECLKPLARPRRAGGALATWPAAWPAAPPAAMWRREMVTCRHYGLRYLATVNGGAGPRTAARERDPRPSMQPATASPPLRTAQRYHLPRTSSSTT